MKTVYINNKAYKVFDITLYPNFYTKSILDEYFEEAEKIFLESLSIQREYNLSLDLSNQKSLFSPTKNKEGKTVKNDDIRYISKEKMKVLFTKLIPEFTFIQNISNKDLSVFENVFLKSTDLLRDFFASNNNISDFDINRSVDELPLNVKKISIFENSIFIPTLFEDNINVESEDLEKLVSLWNKFKCDKRNLLLYDIRASIVKKEKYHLMIYILTSRNTLFQKFIYNNEWLNKPFGEPVGIDLGARKDNWIVDSNKVRIHKPNIETLTRQLNAVEKKIVALSWLPDKNKDEITSLNIERNTIKEKILKRMGTVVDKYVEQLLETKPLYVVLETISEDGMLFTEEDEPNYRKRLFHNLNIKSAHLEELSNMIYGALVNQGINVIKAHKYYASTKICPNCGKKNNIGSSEIYTCEFCGYTGNRDEGSTINLVNYPITEVSSCYAKNDIIKFKKKFNSKLYENKLIIV